MSELHISGNIYATHDKYERCGYSYVIRPKNGMGWGIPVRDLTPEDLRMFADHLEDALAEKRDNKQQANHEQS